MSDQRRQHERLRKHLTMQFCLADVHPPKWDMSIVDNISAGGVKFTASSELKITDKRIVMQIKLPELVPNVLKLEAVVLSAELLYNGKSYAVRARFINLTDADKHNIQLLENIINENLKRQH